MSSICSRNTDTSVDVVTDSGTTDTDTRAAGSEVLGRGAPGVRALGHGAIEVESVADLAEILRPDLHMLIWHRPIDPRLVAFADRHLATLGAVDSDRRVGRADRLNSLLPAPFVVMDPIGAALFDADVRWVCQLMTELFAAVEFGVTLERLDRAMCPRFHVDNLGIRALITYCGVGTEWLLHEHVDRRLLGSAGSGRPDHVSGLQRCGAVVQRVPRFSLALLKGEAWPGADGFGVVHRSPDPGDQPRLLVRIDMLSQSMDAAQSESPHHA